jgi:hypothetical protein
MLGVRRHHAQLLLARQHLLAILVPAHVELALILLDPFRCDVMRRVHRAEGQPGEPGLVRLHRVVLRRPADGAVDEILGQVITLLGQARLIDGFPIEKELGVPLVAVSAEEAVEAVEPKYGTGRPAIVGAGDRSLLRGRVVPLADAEARIAVLV